MDALTRWMPEMSRSTKPYDIDVVKHRNEILEVATLPLDDLYKIDKYRLRIPPLSSVTNKGDESRPHASRAGPPSVAHTPVLPPTADLGRLDRVPLELQLDIIKCLDIHSSMQFKQVNRQASRVVDAMIEYRLSTTYAQDALRDIKSLGLTDYVRFADLARAMYSIPCSSQDECGHVGSHLYLPTMQRICRQCGDKSTDFAMVALKKETSEDSPGPSGIQLTVGVPGKKFDFCGFSVLKEMDGMVACADLNYLLGFTADGHDSDRWAILETWYAKNPWYGPMTYHFQRCLRLTASVTLPHLDRNGDPDHGIRCRGCRDTLNVYFQEKHRRMNEETTEEAELSHRLMFLAAKSYLRDGFLDHFKWCPGAQKLWKARQKAN
ncbi:hypothetical protein B0T16DRAFT_449376 [Cercophora newfieldiana]|uniref:F-box domain-containing protein n=1 Tax=Cercophora newfieldiana TaxID=92897 RepID=A0AA39XXL2_9PEZI|nr:hypothetical protein B0T16DRAFT_449376 [Cercophora newfieldiana]